MRSLLFATTYVDTPERLRVLNRWIDRAMRSGTTDVMLIDSASPLFPYVPERIKFFSFRDNVGHVNRGGRDGWGRAFCMGLDVAVEQKYDYVAHVEGDSILIPPVQPMLQRMREAGGTVMSIPVSSMPAWIETGLMLLSVPWLAESHFTKRYDWEHRGKRPEPEIVVGDLVGRYELLPLRGMRDDFHELTVDNVDAQKLDWLTHAPLPVMERFAT